MGIANYNQECRKIVMRYSKEWEVSQKNGLKQLLLSCTWLNDIQIINVISSKDTCPNIGIWSRFWSVEYQFIPRKLNVWSDFVGANWNRICNRTQYFIVVQLLLTKIAHFYDNSMKLWQITNIPNTNISGYGAEPNRHWSRVLRRTQNEGASGRSENCKTGKKIIKKPQYRVLIYRNTETAVLLPIIT